MSKLMDKKYLTLQLNILNQNIRNYYNKSKINQLFNFIIIYNLY